MAHVLGVPEPRGHGAVPADGRRVRRQGDAAARLRGDRGARLDADRPSGAAAALPPAGHDDDRQAARLPRRVAGRVRRRGAAAGARRDPHLRRRLEPRPVRAGAGAGAVPRRQRLLGPARPRPRPGRAHPQDLADRVPRLRRPAGDAGDRGRARSVRAAARRRPGRAAPPELLRRRPGHAVREPVRHADRLGLRLGPAGRVGPTWRAASGRSRRTTPRIRTRSVHWR